MGHDVARQNDSVQDRKHAKGERTEKNERIRTLETQVDVLAFSRVGNLGKKEKRRNERTDCKGARLRNRTTRSRRVTEQLHRES
jgi:hypothetical protein